MASTDRTREGLTYVVCVSIYLSMQLKSGVVLNSAVLPSRLHPPDAASRESARHLTPAMLPQLSWKLYQRQDDSLVMVETRHLARDLSQPQPPTCPLRRRPHRFQYEEDLLDVCILVPRFPPHP